MYDTRTTVECAWEGCTNPSKSSYSSSKSKYCTACAPKAHRAWQEAKSKGEEEREEKYAAFARLYARALEAGMNAARNATPTPMVVQQHANPFDDSSEVEQSWLVSEGVCGFAWLTIRPGNSSFAHWAKKFQGASKAYGGGLSIWDPARVGGQSMTRKEAGASAMAAILREGLAELDPKVRVYAQSRMD